MCVVTFSAESGLNNTNFDNAAVVATPYNTGVPGLKGSTGTITFYTFNTSSAATDAVFTFSVFMP